MSETTLKCNKFGPDHTTFQNIIIFTKKHLWFMSVH